MRRRRRISDPTLDTILLLLDQLLGFKCCMCNKLTSKVCWINSTDILLARSLIFFGNIFNLLEDRICGFI